ncbi:hypothetical protein DK26_09930 [Bosea sp. WAO]|uniref:hypothetical protein n=1 Tax=Bosea sp. WAO TaxID=406341 RepID=UPI0007496ACC|nr:hypothetical protein [Bosea sp. WAO]KUL95454.1 hypothetical protein DK26_09930 [Bosea sp. WAO]
MRDTAGHGDGVPGDSTAHGQSQRIPSPAAGLRFAPPHWRRVWLGLDRNEAVLAFVATPLGIVLLHASFFAALALSFQISLSAVALIGLTLLGCALFPARRLLVMAISGFLYILLRPFRSQQQQEFAEKLRETTPELVELPHLAWQAPLAMGFLLLCGLALRLQRRYRASLLARRPVLTQFAVLAALIAGTGLLEPETPAYAALWTLVVIYAASFFFLSYAFVDQRGRIERPVPLHLGFMRPFWGGPSIPFKTLTYLGTFEAKTPAELAATRLRALKLAIWAAMLAGLHALLSAAFYDVADWPTLNEALTMTAQGEAPAITAGWLIVAKNFILTVLATAAFAHVFVAIVRMAGYGIPRNTARPLSARSIAEFWNRYLFYFKELLLDFFFYPAFARWFKAHPRLRIAFATFCAAFVGNLLFTVISQAHLVAEHGLLGAVMRFESYVFYAALLTLALVLSQLRKRKPKPEDGFWRYEVTPRLTVIGFFAVVQIFADESGHLGLAERTDFLLHLFGI